MTTTLRPFRPLLATAFLAALAAACSSNGEASRGPEGPGGDFVSDDPNASSSGDFNGGGPASGTGGASGAGGSAGGGADEGGGAERAIAEADIVQLDGDRLYALSRYGGLSVIDVSQRDRLKLLGRLKLSATPFEMYVRDGVVLALYSDWGSYSADGVWRSTSQVVAIDARDPAKPTVRGEFRMPGEVSDSRIVGDVLYVVAYENGSCWDCDSSARTVVASLDVRDPAAMSRVDQLAFNDTNDQWGWSRRSVTVTPERMYVAGPEYGADGSASSTIQVIDISDPAGDLRPGATVQAAGEISSRWQMDEHGGVLRVISQPSTWRLDQAPTVQTFTVTSATEVTPLGSAQLVLPRPEQLQSVRFDGPRGYAITFERTDPLFTIDLSDPAQPKQVGELEMPGWLYHMEPRGDRLFGLGFDQGNAEGGLHVSIFDVSNLAAPTMLDRVSFGGDWASVGEDQDRIHKAFRVLDDTGLILVPFSGYSYSSDGYGCSSYESGIQLISFAGDDLVRRGVAPSKGEARRALLHQTRLLAVSDDAVRTFDIDDLDQPKKVTSIALAVNVQATAAAGDVALRLGSDWWSETATLDVVRTGEASSPQALGSIDLESVLRDGEGACYGGGFYSARVFGSGTHAYVVYDDYIYDYTGGYGYEYRTETAVAVIDVSDPAAPKLVSNTSLGFTASTSYGWYGYGYGGWGLVDGGQGVVQLGDALAFRGSKTTYGDDGQPATREAWIDVVDLSAPARPVVTRVAEAAAGEAFTALHVSGGVLLSSHYEPVEGETGRVRFFLDRVDLSKPAAPVRLPSVNVPGSLLAWDAPTQRAVLVDYHHGVERDVTSNACYEAHGYGNTQWEPNDPYWYEKSDYDPNVQPLGTCLTITHSLKLAKIGGSGAWLEGSAALPEGTRISGAAAGDGRVFVSLESDYGWGWGYPGDCWDCGGYGWGSTERKLPLLVLSGFGSGGLVKSVLELEASDCGYTRHLVASGHRALLSTGWRNELVVVDAKQNTSPYVVRRVPIAGYPQQVTVAGDTALVSMGYDGVEAVKLTD
ncbi:MAG: beta-propeller domain-containing protein [Polyangiaceae bacterium]|nr:beta-propeller domain-containing protein [Polyangiaceae bacterium]